MNEKKRNAKHLHHPFHMAYLTIVPIILMIAIGIWALSLQKARNDLKRIGLYIRGIANPGERGSIIYHVVRDYDTLDSLAEEYHISVDTILWANDLPDGLRQDMIIMIPPVTGVVHVVKMGETVESIAALYGVSPKAITDYPSNTFSEDKAFPIRPGQILIVPGGNKNFKPLNIPES